jgi:hypothetical protein
VALGNFVHLIENDPRHTALHRASFLVNQLARFAVSLGNQEHVSAFAQYGFGGNATKSAACAYLLGTTNWNGCLDDWMQKAQAHLVASGEGFLSSVGAFTAGTQNGFALGLPFGTSTAYYTGSPKLDVNRNIVGIVMAYHWLDFAAGTPKTVGGGLHSSVCVVTDWNGYVRTVGPVVGAPAPIDLSNGPFLALAATGTFFADLDLDNTDAYWCDISVNGRAYVEADPLDPEQAYWWQTRIDPTTGQLWTPTYADPPGYKADGQETPYLVDHAKIVAYDPLSPDEKAITTLDFSSAGSYDANQVLAGRFNDIVPGFMHIAKAVQIKRAAFLEQIHGWGTFQMRW